MSDKKEWTLSVFYKGQDRSITAEVIYESAQVQRIKVHGSRSTITLQNNYPIAKLNKKPLQWKLIEGSVSDSQFLTELLQKLEIEVKQG